METTSTNSQAVVDVVADQVEKKLESSLDIGAKALQTPEVQEMIRAYGLESYIKNIRQDQVKNMLALAGVWFMVSKFKKHWPYLIAGLGGLYLYSKSGNVSAPLVATDSASKVVTDNEPEIEDQLAGEQARLFS